MAYILEKSIAKFVTVISILIAVVLLVAIFALYSTNNLTTKLIMVCLLMFLFAERGSHFTTAA